MRLIQSVAFLLIAGILIFAQQRAEETRCSIDIQARIFVQWGPDAIPANKKFYIPIGQRRFYLMDSDPEILLKEAALPSPELQSYDGTNEPTTAGLGIYLSALEIKESGGFYGGNSHLAGFYEKASKIMDPHILQRVVTDRTGKASFAAVPPGTYFIVGSAPPRSEMWNMRIEAKGSNVNLILDEKNSLVKAVERSANNLPIDRKSARYLAENVKNVRG